MGDVVLRDHPLALDSELGHELVEDLARFADGTLSEAAVRKKYRFDDQDWERLGSNDALVEAIENAKTRRIRGGISAKEKAQVLFATTPTVLGSILNDTGASPRHRIESAREIRAIAATGPETQPASDRFIIQINLGEDTLRFNKSIAVDPNDTDPDDPAPQGLLAAIAAKNKPEGGGGGEPV